jgi:hypothetical protein
LYVIEQLVGVLDAGVLHVMSPLDDAPLLDNVSPLDDDVTVVVVEEPQPARSAARAQAARVLRVIIPRYRPLVLS